MNDSILIENVGSLSDIMGINLFEEEIDDVIFQTNEFLTDATFTGDNGPFWWILQMSMCLGALFAIIMAAGMAYKMMVKGEVFDPLKIVRVLGISLVMIFWYGDFSVLDGLAYIPNAIGSYTHDLYEAEAAQVQDKLADITELTQVRDSLVQKAEAKFNTVVDATQNANMQDVTTDAFGIETKFNADENAQLLKLKAAYCGGTVAIDKLLMFVALFFFRVGWWGVIYCQQILLGMLTIFGPIQWAFSLLPKWEGAWAKWITRYLTVHFYGAMLYFVIFRNFLSLCKSDRICFEKCLAQQTNTKSVPIKFVSYQRWYTASETQRKGNKNNRETFLFLPLFYPQNLLVGFTERLSIVLTRLWDVYKIHKKRTFQNFNSMISSEKPYFQVKLSQILPAKDSIFLSLNILGLTLQSEFQRHAPSQLRLMSQPEYRTIMSNL